MSGPTGSTQRGREGTARALSSDLRGAGQLVTDAVGGVVDVVESMHRNISGLAPIVGPSRQGPTRGITGLVYRSVRGISRVAGRGIDSALRQLGPLLEYRGVSDKRENMLATLNGVLGDYLVATGNPLAIPMSFRKDGQALNLDKESLEGAFPAPSPRVLVMVHGLCMNDLRWQRKGHDHGAELARSLGYTPLYLHYNSGLHISTNGREFAGLLEQLVRAWPVPVEELVILGHSMGGLVARSACHYGRIAGHSWPDRLNRLIFLGAPHHGSPLERVGNRVDALAGVSPYVAPIGRLGKIRSAGVKDLRYGNLVDEDWAGLEPEHPHDARAIVALPADTECLAIAATMQSEPDDTGAFTRGDGLVPVTSALGLHDDAERVLPIPVHHQSVFSRLGHFDLLDSQEVYERIRSWLARD
ncbi:Pimeloyl-ACP methyl ester carboxylesterase [Marinobacter daqiaonensis]|uniref:Pimeloyl-ACP methyl ester carboxylesterase n=1 Tax=Marinobacter daqiaonensis TaxID=650891 RepID=A0A1I6JNV0_9GAMM|nr:alpha/beta hydrolase [Marinobacter daqiaonensis]SFR80637.1 Pimeloyl-ACP methyl ester carboxylesterase [Marinobacter daqiaonensis]